MTQNKLIVTDYCKANLRKLGFIYDYGTEMWKYTFTVLFYKRNPVLTCYIYISKDNDFCTIQVVDSFNNPYAPYYSHEYGRYGDYLKKIDRKILYKLKKFHIIVKKKDIIEKRKKRKKTYGSNSKMDNVIS